MAPTRIPRSRSAILSTLRIRARVFSVQENESRAERAEQRERERGRESARRPEKRALTNQRAKGMRSVLPWRTGQGDEGLF